MSHPMNKPLWAVLHGNKTIFIDCYDEKTADRLMVSNCNGSRKRAVDRGYRVGRVEIREVPTPSEDAA